jgi:uncharacterized protein YprB with RNaseH-like and TPR domain
MSPEESLSDKLKALGVRVGASGLPKPQAKLRHTLEAVVRGEAVPTPYGETFAVRQSYPPATLRGRVPVELPPSLARLFEWGRTGLDGACRGPFAFLDTETTGLAGGTGTYAFMVGVARFDERGFDLAQFFMRDPSEEPALLAAVESYLQGCRAMVTFNGKAFDAPLLNARYTMQGLASPLPGMPHLDLLPLARRLWRDRLPSRALGYLETSVLGAARTQDEVPGWMIPELYFDYLRSGDARPLAGVFYHNAMDVLSLGALFNLTGRFLEDPLGESIDENSDRVAIARLYDDLGRTDEAVVIYRNALERGLSENAFWETVERLSMLFRRIGDWPSAIELWRKAADAGQIYACVELAKYYEHRAVDLQAARTWTETAVQKLDSAGLDFYQRRQTAFALQHRLERLQRKIERGASASVDEDDEE